MAMVKCASWKHANGIQQAATAGVPMFKEAEAVTTIATQIFGHGLVAVYLYGSFVSGGLRPQSDVDLIIVIDRPMTAAERKASWTL
jgi:predicted nucleotidyltransferase